MRWLLALLLALLPLTGHAQSGAALPSGYLSVVGNQFQDGSSNNVRIAATTYRGTPADTTTMPAIRAAGFNTIVLDWRDALLNGTAGTGCNTLADIDTCVAHATAAGLKVILSHRGNEAPVGACASIQQNGLWFDNGGSSGGADGCGTTGGVTYANFKANTVALLQRYANNATVIGYELHHAPLVDGVFTGAGGGGGTGTFHVASGKVIDPHGNVFTGRGTGIYVGQASLSLIQSLFPNLNFIRLAIGNQNCLTGTTLSCAEAVATVEAYARSLTAAGIVVMIDPHYSSQQGAGTIDHTAEFNYISQLATDLKDDQYVWFESGNELTNPGVTAEHQNVYNAVRNAGNNSIVVLCVTAGNPPSGGGNPDGPASAYSSMTNIIWDQHVYNWMMSGTTDQPTANNDASGFISGDQAFATEAGGATIPVGFFEAGTQDVLDGDATSICRSGACVSMQAAMTVGASSGVGFAAWLWQFPGYTGGNLVNDANNARTVNGDFVNTNGIALGPAPTPPGSSSSGPGTFTVSGGDVIGPDGKPYRAFGVNVLDDELGSATVQNIQALFPKLNTVRLAVGADCPPPPAGFQCAQPLSTIESWVTSVTAQHIVVMIESHSCNGNNLNANQLDAAGLANFYGTLAGFFKGNPYVWFEDVNECGDPGMTAENQNMYNAVRGAGNNTIVAFEVSFFQGNQPDGPASAYNSMTNVIWTPHSYNNNTNGSTDQNVANSTQAGMVTAGRNYTTESGGQTMPAMFSEVGFIDYAGVCGGQQGSGTLANSFNCGSGQIVTAALSPSATGAIGGLIWLWYYVPCCQQQTDLVDRNSSPLTYFDSYGTTVESLINANSPGPVSPGVSNPAVNWGGGGDTDIQAACSDVGAAVNAVNPGVILFCPGPLNNGTALLSGAAKP